MIVLCLLVLLVPSTAFAQRVKVADTVVVTKTRDAYTVVWQATEDGTLTTSELSAVAYQALGAVDAPPPVQTGLPGGKTWQFVSASKNDEYSTASGLLEPGNIYVTENEIFVVLTPDRETQALDKQIYTITDTGGRTLAITPDPPGLEVRDGEVYTR